jgi:hypothetical protein
MLALQLALTILILAFYSFAPGFFIVRRCRWSPMEKLCGALGLSLVLVFLAGWVVFALWLPWTPCAILISVATAVLTALAWRDVRQLFRSARVRQTSIAFGLLLLWTLTILASIRHYSGAGWGGDWLEHFDRTVVYFHHLPPSTLVFGDYRIPARPPLMHIVTALVMAQTQDAFEIYQFAFVFLSLLLFFPCSLLLSDLARPWKFGTLPLAAIFALSPVIMVNATYTGAKACAAFFVITSIAFYLRGWKKGDSKRMTVAFTCAAGGCLAHYSAMPYAIFLGLHYLIAVFPKRAGRVREIVTHTTATAVPLLAWFGWCVATLGFRGSLMSAVNTSVGFKYNAQESYLLKTLANIFDAIVPHPLRDWALVEVWRQSNTLGYLRDNIFPIYQVSLVFTLGLVGGPLVWWLVFRALRRHHTPERNFWLTLIPFVIAACFILAGERDHFGQAHIVLLSMMAIGLTLLASRFTARRWISLLIVAGCAVDFMFGILLQARVEHMENTATATPFTMLQLGPTVLNVAPNNPLTLSSVSAGNWFRKHQYALADKWLRSLEATNPGGRGLDAAEQSAKDSLIAVRRLDETMFGGWYKRHRGEITFFGDHFGDSDVPTALLIIGAAALLWKLARYAPPQVAAKPLPVRTSKSKTNRAKKA